MITTVLVANRGEIARRVFRTCRDLGLGTVAVHSDADAGAPHVAEADAAVRLPGVAPADTYLRADLLVEAALRAGADAVHPGYGFLSEQAGFARDVVKAGLTWIGPPADAIEAMGSKVAAKRLVAQAGVPVLAELDPATLTEADLPVLVKASAGGGGRGMRVVRSLSELDDQLAAARAEAAAAFGDPTVFCEPYLPTGHHVEVQVLADQHGTVWTVGERECSLQRRHQKILEESPSPLVRRTPGMRDRLLAAARAATTAIGYAGAGTVEFLAAGDGRFFFLEMNTRLQVEHPVTEAVTGLDLVREQLRVAAGSPLPADPPLHSGHAIEVRLYAEDPAQDWQPRTGTLHRLHVPGVTVEFATAPTPAGLRLDSGVADGDEISVHYDPMLAKLIAWAPDRAEAAARLAAALARARIHGVSTNRDLLVRVLRHEDFLTGDTDTSFLTTHALVGKDDQPGLADPLADADAERLAALAAALSDAAANGHRGPLPSGIPTGWRNIPSQPQVKRYLGRSGEIETRYRLDRSGLITDQDGTTLISMTPDQVVLEISGLRRTFDIARYPDLVCVDSPLGPVSLRPVPRFVVPGGELAAGSLRAPMPGVVVRVGVAVGDTVEKGQPMLWLSAMKMEHTIAAPHAGTVAELPVRDGQQVELGAVLAVLATAETLGGRT
jgi:propionyl-CoA carboxylase alpha chain